METIEFSQETLNEMEMDSIVGGTNDEEQPTFNCFGGYCGSSCQPTDPIVLV
jgi:natural product precursor